MTLDASLPARIVELLQADGVPVGGHLAAQGLADRLQVSRSPVNDALALLHAKGVVRREPRRGYFLARPLDAPPHLVADAVGLGPDAPHPAAGAYARITEDRLQGALPDTCSEAFLRKRYGLTAGQLDGVLARIAEEGWVRKNPGYGWAFSPMLTTPESLLQSYRLRLAIEPAALLEPGYQLPAATLARCRATEQHLLDGGIETDTAEQLHDRGVRFHEALVAASGNPFFIDAIRRVNRVRRLLSYRSMQDRSRYAEQARQHLALLDLLAAGRQAEAADCMREHLRSTVRNLERLRGLLQP